MTGLKSGTGDDLWDDEDDEADEDAEALAEREPGEDVSDASGETLTDRDGPAAAAQTTQDEKPYIVRRAVRDEGVQFERPERLTFFVHDDVADGERKLKAGLEAEFGRDLPKFDVREAVYRAALRDPEAVRRELERMGYDASQSGGD